MIVISKDKEINTVVLSQLDKPYNTFTLVLYSDYTKKDYTIDLGVDYSTGWERYTKFFVPQLAVTELETGEYNYIFMADDTVITYGVLLLTSTTDEVQYDAVVPAVDDNDFYVVQTK